MEKASILQAIDTIKEDHAHISGTNQKRFSIIQISPKIAQFPLFKKMFPNNKKKENLETVVVKVSATIKPQDLNGNLNEVMELAVKTCSPKNRKKFFVQ